jgi:plastocyanin
MRVIIGLLALGGAALGGIASRGSEAPHSPATKPAATQPATQSASPPATRPAAQLVVQPVSIRGRVAVGSGLDLVKPNLSRVVVYIASNPALDSLPLTAEKPEVVQRNKQFIPNFLAIARGTEVEFPNWDHYSHNVFSRSKAAPAFDLERYPYGSSKSRQFTKVGVVQVFCNVHPDMRAMIFVAPNKCFCRADDEGHFELRGVPPGRYEVVAWHERCEEQRNPVEISAAVVEIAFALEPNRKNILANDPPERGGTYSGIERGLGIRREKLDLPVVEEVHPAPAK